MTHLNSLAHYGDDSSFTMAIIQLLQHVRSRSNSFRLISDDRKYSDHQPPQRRPFMLAALCCRDFSSWNMTMLSILGSIPQKKHENTIVINEPIIIRQSK